MSQQVKIELSEWLFAKELCIKYFYFFVLFPKYCFKHFILFCMLLQLISFILASVYIHWLNPSSAHHCSGPAIRGPIHIQPFEIAAQKSFNSANDSKSQQNAHLGAITFNGTPNVRLKIVLRLTQRISSFCWKTNKHRAAHWGFVHVWAIRNRGQNCSYSPHYAKLLQNAQHVVGCHSSWNVVSFCQATKRECKMALAKM